MEAETTEFFVIEFRVFTAAKYSGQEMFFELGNEELCIETEQMENRLNVAVQTECGTYLYCIVRLALLNPAWNAGNGVL